MADENAAVQELEQSDSLVTPVAPESDALAPVAEPASIAESADDRYFRLHLDDAEFSDVQTLFEKSPRAKEIALAMLGRERKAQFEAEKAALQARAEAAELELNRRRFASLAPEVQQQYRDTNHPLVQQLAQQPVAPEVAQYRAHVNAEFSSAFETIAAQGVPPQALSDLQKAVQDGYFGQGNPLAALDNLKRYAATELVPYWAQQRQASRQQAQPASRQTQAAAPVAPVTTNPGLRGPGPDTSPRGSSPSTGKQKVADLSNEDIMKNWKPGSLINRAHNGELLLSSD